MKTTQELRILEIKEGKVIADVSMGAKNEELNEVKLPEFMENQDKYKVTPDGKKILVPDEHFDKVTLEKSMIEQDKENDVETAEEVEVVKDEPIKNEEVVENKYNLKNNGVSHIKGQHKNMPLDISYKTEFGKENTIFDVIKFTIGNEEFIVNDLTVECPVDKSLSEVKASIRQAVKDYYDKKD